MIDPATRAPGGHQSVSSHDVLAPEDWEMTAADAAEQGVAPTALDGWRAASVPGTAGAALRAAPGPTPLDAQDWWWRWRFAAEAAAADEQVMLCLDGVATVSDVFLNGERIGGSGSMFETMRLDVSDRLAGENELLVCCRALAPVLARSRRPRARWRTRVVDDGNLRWVRTALLGRMPGYAPGPGAVGPWRAVWLERRRVVGVAAADWRVRGTTVTVTASVDPLGDRELRRAEAVLTRGDRRERVDLRGEGGRLVGAVEVADPARWWPHTHGEPALWDAALELDVGGEAVTVTGTRIGFRELEAPADLDAEGLSLRVNGVEVFARGAVWVPPDPVSLAAPAGEVRAQLEVMRDAGMNIVRLAGIGCYESLAFHDLCDELGMLVWQEAMLANLDYPFADEAFHRAVRDEVRDVIGALAHRPSLAVVCGGSEVAQQVAMLGLDPALARDDFYVRELPELVRSTTQAAYVPSSPWGGDLPFRPRAGVAHYFGVGGYRRGLDDARRAEVPFASECLAFSHVPGEEGVAAVGGLEGERWKPGVPRDQGADWDFEDVRDHYLRECYRVDPGALRAADPERYLELSRAITGDVMAEVMGEWRRSGSRCAGAIVLWLRDVLPGAGWGLLDHEGRPKVALRRLARVLAPVAVWSTDEGMNGVDLHAANDTPEAIAATLRVALYRDERLCVEEASTSLALAAHSVVRLGVEEVLGRFVDVNWAYRFGDPNQDLLVATLETSTGPIAQTIRPLLGPPVLRTAEQLGLRVRVERGPGAVTVRVGAPALLYGVRVVADGRAAEPESVDVEPGGEAVFALAPFADGWVSALNLAGRHPLR